MKTLKLMLSIVCAALMLTAGQVYGQRRDSSVIMPPQKGNNAHEQALKLAEDGWKTEQYSIEEQLASTWKLMCEYQSDNESVFLWARNESTAASMAEAKMATYMQCVRTISYQVQLVYMSQCRLIMTQRNMSSDQIAEMEKTVRHITPLVLQNNSMKSMELYKENDKSYTVQSVFVVKKAGIYDELMRECANFMSNNKNSAIYTEIFKEASSRLNKKSIR